MNIKTYEKIITLEVKSTFEKKNIKTETTLKAELTTDNFNFEAIINFEKEKQKIDRFIKRMIKQCQYFEMTITISEYSKDENYNCKQLTFNHWKFSGIAEYTENEEEMGIYLSPDTRYTPENFDVWYNFTLESLPNI
jgi:bifunctional ADP-heptose synthase (sugar kinase/adenylyltransferase)